MTKTALESIRMDSGPFRCTPIHSYGFGAILTRRNPFVWIPVYSDALEFVPMDFKSFLWIESHTYGSNAIRMRLKAFVALGMDSGAFEAASASSHRSGSVEIAAEWIKGRRARPRRLQRLRRLWIVLEKEGAPWQGAP
ncbi:MAG TPA: hypothetical protein VN493_10365 [Thermoanaerobaculia bacterium]|nr:hypothetical protein [Thermoanaerobaculia bacterium]